MDTILESITLKQLRALEGVLSNDENSSDEELYRYFIDELGLTDTQAKQAVTLQTTVSAQFVLARSRAYFRG